MKTQRGNFTRDPSGLFHYQNEGNSGQVALVAADAIAYHSISAAWFWFNGTPTPIQRGDTPDILSKRWFEWRQGWIQNPVLLSLLKKYAGIEK